MKFLLFLLSFAAISNSFSQLFSLSDSVFTFQKNTSQSPIHWYVEINNLAGADTTLRWKAKFNHIPAEWVVNFDTQTLNTTGVQHLDSADFTLLGTSNPPQKLIIGVDLQNKISNGNIVFELYNPLNSSDQTTLTFAFQITASLDEIIGAEDFKIENQKLILLHSEIQLELYNPLGQKLIANQVSKEEFLLPKGDFYLSLQKNGQLRIIHLVNPK